MPTYLSPGVYVEEVPSSVQPIAGVSTSTAAFIGIFPKTFELAHKRIFKNETLGIVSQQGQQDFALFSYPVETDSELEVDIGSQSQQITPVNHAAEGRTTISISATEDQVGQKVVIKQYQQTRFVCADHTVDGTEKVGAVTLCTNFADYARVYGEFGDKGSDQWILSHAVQGFFNNGGSRCHIIRISAEQNLSEALQKLEAIDEISIIAVPGLLGQSQNNIAQHCERLRTRVAILDAPIPESVTKLQNFHPTKNPTDETNLVLPGASAYAALYYPWIEIDDPVTNTRQQVPPSGHIAGIYARVDHTRGVQKAPANEVVMGANLTTLISSNEQDGLNPQGVNCIRKLNGNILVWGARTWGGDDNGEYKYINVRRLMIYLEQSIDRGTQWVVFEPNTEALWAKVKRNVGAFLRDVWRSGALFGTTEQEAFYVRCDVSLNPSSVRDQGQLIIEVGVAPVRPAEFVVFRLSQWTGPGNN